MVLCFLQIAAECTAGAETRAGCRRLATRCSPNLSDERWLTDRL